MAAEVSIPKLTKPEHDLLVEAVEFVKSNAERFAKDPDTDFKLRSEQRKVAVLASDLLKKIS